MISNLKAVAEMTIGLVLIAAGVKLARGLSVKVGKSLDRESVRDLDCDE
jgi:hypothetical protein